MFTTGRIIFAVLFLITFTALLIWSYGKDAKKHKEYYKNAAKKVALFSLLIVILFVIIRVYIGH